MSSSQIDMLPPRLQVLYDLVVEYAAVRRYEMAVPLCRLALAEYEALLGLEHPVLSNLQNILATMYCDYILTLDNANNKYY